MPQLAKGWLPDIIGTKCKRALTLYLLYHTKVTATYVWIQSTGIISCEGPDIHFIQNKIFLQKQNIFFLVKLHKIDCTKFTRIERNTKTTNAHVNEKLQNIYNTKVKILLVRQKTTCHSSICQQISTGQQQIPNLQHATVHVKIGNLTCLNNISNTKLITMYTLNNEVN